MLRQQTEIIFLRKKSLLVLGNYTFKLPEYTGKLEEPASKSTLYNFKPRLDAGFVLSN